jgi:catechol 2,3-dioxygenase
MNPPLSADFRLGPVTLRVSDAERALRFYEQTVGLEVVDRTRERIALGAGGETLLVLEIRSGIAPRNERQSGLYHVAILVPDRASLGSAIARTAANDVRIGAADHRVSEAIYLWDQDRNGIEIYRDRPRDEWTWQDGQVEMRNLRLDFDGLLAEPGARSGAKGPMPSGTRIGHLHLQTDSLSRSRGFYAGAIGFTPTATMPGALFMSAGGYHHHVAANIWHSEGGPLPSPDTAGLEAMTFEFSSRDSMRDLATRLGAAGIDVVQHGDGYDFVDPWLAKVGVRLRD